MTPDRQTLLQQANGLSEGVLRSNGVISAEQLGVMLGFELLVG
jgi:hypothetical protein